MHRDSLPLPDEVKKQFSVTVSSIKGSNESEIVSQILNTLNIVIHQLNLSKYYFLMLVV